MIRCDETKPYIFISYSHRDSKTVVEIINRMSEEGYNVWYDEGIDPGTEWDENIANHVNGCAYFIAFISNGYIGSDNCKDELNYARDLEKERLLVYLEEVDLPMGMAMRMNRIQAIWWNKYDETNIDNAYIKLFSTNGIEKTKIREKKVEEESVKEEPTAENKSKAEEQIEKISDVHTTQQDKIASPAQQSIKCEKCGYETKTSMRFCRQCGSPMNVSTTEKQVAEVKLTSPVNQGPKSSPNPQVNQAAKVNPMPQASQTPKVNPIPQVKQAPKANPMPQMNQAVPPAVQKNKKKFPVWGWILIGLGIIALLSVILLIFGILFVGCFSDDTNNVSSSSGQSYETYESYDEYDGYDEYDEYEFYYYDMGINYCNGENGYEQDGYMAIEYFQMAIDSGDDWGYFGIGYVYTGLSTVPGDYELAVEYFDIGLEKTGDNVYAYWPAMMYFYGDDTLDPDYEKCLEYAQMAVDAGDMDALGFMAACYYEGGYGIEQDYDLALEYFQDAEYYEVWQLGENGNSWFMGCYAYCYAMSGDYENALIWFENAENAGGITDSAHLMMYEAIK